jgi:hypothetical protein
LLAQAMDDPAVARCTLSIDKVTGLARLSTSGTDGRTATHDILGPGLAGDAGDRRADQPPVPGRSGAQARAARDAQILRAAARGLTQTETARVLGISQALVSRSCGPASRRRPERGLQDSIAQVAQCGSAATT